MSNIQLKQFSNTETHFIAYEDGCENGYNESVYDIPLNIQNLQDANMAKFYWAELDNKGRARMREPEVSVEQMVQYLYAQAAIQNAVDSFERRVWFPKLQKQVNDSRRKGMSAKLNGIEIFSFAMCGRVMFTIKRKGKDITLITADTEKPYEGYGSDVLRRDRMGPMGIQSLNCSANEACDILFELIASRDKIKLKGDDKVNIGF